MSIYRRGPSPPPRGANLSNGRHQRMSGSMVAGPRFESANLGRTESGEERLALHKNHEGRAQAVAAIRGYGTTAHVQVFGRRHDEPFHALWRPASKKRQGTKSREVGHWRCNGRYGDLMAAPSLRVDVRPTGCGRRICALARLEA